MHFNLIQCHVMRVLVYFLISFGAMSTAVMADLQIGVDLNGDGMNEIAVGCEDGSALVYDSQGAELARFALGAAIVALSIGDVDGDNVPDLGAASADGRVRVLKLRGDGAP